MKMIVGKSQLNKQQRIVITPFLTASLSKSQLPGLVLVESDLSVWIPPILAVEGDLREEMLDLLETEFYAVESGEITIVDDAGTDLVWRIPTASSMVTVMERGTHYEIGMEALPDVKTTCQKLQSLAPLSAPKPLLCLTQHYPHFLLPHCDRKWDSHIELRYLLQKLVKSIGANRHHPMHQLISIEGRVLLRVKNSEREVYDSMTECLIAGKQQYWEAEASGRRKFPKDYYSSLWEKAKVVFPLILPSPPHICFIDQSILIKILKYAFIENLMAEDFPQPPLLMPAQIKSIASIPPHLLETDPLSPTLIIYWHLTITPTLSTDLYRQIQEFLLPFNVTALTIPNIGECLEDFLGRCDLFPHDRFAYLLIDVPFTPSLLESVISMVEARLPAEIHYQLKLIGEKRSLHHEFKEEQIHTSISYSFSLPVILCSILQEIRGNTCDPITLLRNSLHYLSANYGNLQAERLVQHGNVGVIECTYEGVRVDWESVEEGGREELEDLLRVLLQMSYKGEIGDDPLLWYFLDSLDALIYHFETRDVLEQVMEQSFPPLPNIDFK